MDKLVENEVTKQSAVTTPVVEKASRYDEFNEGNLTAAMGDIEFGDRFRADYGDMDSLETSFDDIGLIQPLAVKLNPPGSAKKYKLLAGGRRFFALAKAKKPQVLIRIYPETIDEEDLRRIEFMENYLRKDMTWQEKAKLEEDIHRIQVAKYGEKISTSPNAAGWSQSDTAALLKKSKGGLSETLKMARAMEAHPEVKDATDLKDAKRILKRIEVNKEKDAMAQEFAKRALTDSKDQLRIELAKCYILGDAIERMKSIAADTFDLIEIDPPYGIDYKNMKSSGPDKSSSVLNYTEIPAEEYKAFMTNVLTEAYRVAKPNAWVLLWYGIEPWHDTLINILRDVGWKGSAIPAIWNKIDSPIQTMQPTRYLARGHEQFFYFRKGDPGLQKHNHSDVFSFQAPPTANRIHPTERSVPMLQEILSTFIAPGSTVLVPFLGSGNTLLAANNLHMNAFGFDLAKEYKDAYTVRVYEGIPREYK